MDRNNKQLFVMLTLYNGETFSGFKKCLKKLHLSLVYETESGVDYSRCAASKYYNIEPDWNQNQFL